MEAVIQMLKEKNDSLEKFYRLNEAELENIVSGNFDNVEKFYTMREGLLEIIKKIDELIEESNEMPLEGGHVQDAHKKTVRQHLNHKNELVARILEQDLKILSAIEDAKSLIIKELTLVKATKKAVGSYKSGRSIKRLDEEA
ncbi:MAG: hypothetical protein ABL927_05560 [Bdellovibrionales bacterium]